MELPKSLSWFIAWKRTVYVPSHVARRLGIWEIIKLNLYIFSSKNWNFFRNKFLILCDLPSLGAVKLLYSILNCFFIICNENVTHYYS